MSASPYLTAAEAAAFVRKTPQAFYAFLYRRRKAGRPVRTRRIGRMLLFRQADLEAEMPVEQARGQLRKASGF